MTNALDVVSIPTLQVKSKVRREEPYSLHNLCQVSHLSMPSKRSLAVDSDDPEQLSLDSTSATPARKQSFFSTLKARLSQTFTPSQSQSRPKKKQRTNINEALALPSNEASSSSPSFSSSTGTSLYPTLPSTTLYPPIPNTNSMSIHLSKEESDRHIAMLDSNRSPSSSQPQSLSVPITVAEQQLIREEEDDEVDNSLQSIELVRSQQAGSSTSTPTKAKGKGGKRRGKGRKGKGKDKDKQTEEEVVEEKQKLDSEMPASIGEDTFKEVAPAFKSNRFARLMEQEPVADSSMIGLAPSSPKRGSSDEEGEKVSSPTSGDVEAAMAEGLPSNDQDGNSGGAQQVVEDEVVLPQLEKGEDPKEEIVETSEGWNQLESSNPKSDEELIDDEELILEPLVTKSIQEGDLQTETEGQGEEEGEEFKDGRQESIEPAFDEEDDEFPMEPIKASEEIKKDFDDPLEDGFENDEEILIVNGNQKWIQHQKAEEGLLLAEEGQIRNGGSEEILEVSENGVLMEEQGQEVMKPSQPLQNQNSNLEEESEEEELIQEDKENEPPIKSSIPIGADVVDLTGSDDDDEDGERILLNNNGDDSRHIPTSARLDHSSGLLNGNSPGSLNGYGSLNGGNGITNGLSSLSITRRDRVGSSGSSIGSIGFRAPSLSGVSNLTGSTTGGVRWKKKDPIGMNEVSFPFLGRCSSILVGKFY